MLPIVARLVRQQLQFAPGSLPSKPSRAFEMFECLLDTWCLCDTPGRTDGQQRGGLCVPVRDRFVKSLDSFCQGELNALPN
jgi:hypothetical protein